ncbi:MAG: PH domain-containing protein [Mucilaginibacter sp.]
MTYESKKDWVLPAAMGVLLIITILPVSDGKWGVVLLIAPVLAWFLWMWFDTYYIIKDGELFYKSSFMKGSVPISTMHQIIRHNKGLHSCSLKPALSIKGLIIKYNRWDDMFVSPENAEQFIAELQAINPAITVVG